MISVQFHGWDPGFDKVALNRLLRQHVGMPLATAKQIVDRILTGESVVIPVNSQEAADVLIHECRDVSVRCKVVAQASSVQSATTD